MRILNRFIDKRFAISAARVSRFACYLVMLFMVLGLLLSLAGRQRFRLQTYEGSFETALCAQQDPSAGLNGPVVNMADSVVIRSNAENRVDLISQVALSSCMPARCSRCLPPSGSSAACLPTSATEKSSRNKTPSSCSYTVCCNSLPPFFLPFSSSASVPLQTSFPTARCSFPPVPGCPPDFSTAFPFSSPPTSFTTAYICRTRWTTRYDCDTAGPRPGGQENAAE